MAAAVDRLKVTDVHVDLVVYRGGQALSDGTRVRAGGGWVEGTATYHLNRAARAGDTLVLLDFAGFMAREPKAIDEIALDAYVPTGPFEAGAFVLKSWVATRSISRGAATTLSYGPLVVEVEPGAREISLSYSVAVPRRYWPFGCIRRRCSLSGALAPLPSEPARGGRWLPESDRVVAPAKWWIDRVRFATSGAVAPRSGREKSHPDEIVVAGGKGELTRYPSVFWGPRWRRATSVHRGVQISVLHPFSRPQTHSPHESFFQLKRDVPGRTIEIAQELVDLMDRWDIPLAMGTPVVVVQGPLRQAVAEFHPGVVVLSDRAFELLPSASLLSFHRDAVAHAVAQLLLELRAPATRDPSTELWINGAAAFAMVDIWRHLREMGDVFASELVRMWTFVPSVDRFLYGQQVGFARTYFGNTGGAEVIRNHPLWFSHQLPGGGVLHGKFSDLLAARQLTSFYEQVIVENARGDPQQIAEKIYGHELAWFFDQWLGPYPSVDYLIDSVRRRRVGKKWSYAITIAKHSRRPVIEPVQVLAEEYGGARHFLIWNGEAGEDNENLIDEPVSGKHTFEIVTNRRLRYVRVDPRSRLAEQARPPRANVDPRFNNRSPPSFRFLYTGAQLSIAASEFVNAKTTAARFNAITGFFAFEGSLRRDLRRSGSVTIARDRETDVEGGLGIGFGFGEKTNPQRRRARVSLFATASLLNARSLDPRGGVRTTQRIGLSDDTTRVGWWPESGRRLSIGLLARQIHRVDDGPEDPAYDLSIDAGWTHLWRLAHHHVLATSLFGQMVIPIEGPTEFRALTRAGGIGGLSGYVGDELFGLAMLLAQAEYRHEFVGDLRVNFFNLIHLRGFGGVLFGGGASLSRCDSYGGWFAPDSWYGHIGYGLTARLALLGVSPQLVRLDVSVPLVRRRTTCLGRDLPDYLAEVQGLEDASRLLPPLQFNLSFVHPF